MAPESAAAILVAYATSPPFLRCSFFRTGLLALGQPVVSLSERDLEDQRVKGSARTSCKATYIAELGGKPELRVLASFATSADVTQGEPWSHCLPDRGPVWFRVYARPHSDDFGNQELHPVSPFAAPRPTPGDGVREGEEAFLMRAKVFISQSVLAPCSS